MTAMRIRSATAADRDALLALLAQAALPTGDLDAASMAQFRVAADDGRLLGAVAVEPFSGIGLLRSLAVAPSARHRGLGAALVAAAERAAVEAGIAELFLLTPTAQCFFERLGYALIPRDGAPASVQAHAQFRSLCPASAVCMRKSLRGAQLLFLCTGNSGRSILAEATFNHLAHSGWRALSGGSRPTGQVNPRSLALLRRMGIATAGCRSKSWEELRQTPDVVITVCASAAGESCPAYLGPAVRAHWGVEDPAQAIGSDAQIDAAFEQAYRTLRRRIEALLALPLTNLKGDRARLKAELDRIGTTVE
jgi:arsenate reductase